MQAFHFTQALPMYFRVWTHLVCLVIVLGVILEHLWLLFIVKVLHEIIHTTTKLFPPLLAIDEPA